MIKKKHIPTKKEKKWKEYEILEYVAALREEQKVEPAPMILRSKIYDLAGLLYLDGYTCIEISKLVGMAVCTVYRVLRRKNIFKAQDRSIPKELEENVVQMYMQGQETRQISAQLGITVPSIRWILIKNKIPSHRTRIIIKKEKPGPKTLEEAARMYQEGILYQDIKTATGLNNTQLYDAVRKSGTRIRDGIKGKTKERIAAEKRAIHLYRNTNTYVGKITKETGIPFSTLTRLLKKRNIPLRGNPQLKEEQIEEAIGLYRKGWTNKAIYEKTGVSPSGLTWILQSRNIPLKGRRQSAIDKDLQEKVISMYQEGYIIKEIIKQTGVKDIYTILKRYNIPNRDRLG